MQNSQIRCGVVGVGHLGSIHARLLAGMDDVALSGVYDRNLQSASRIATELGVVAFEEFDDLLAECDMVTIVTPTIDHSRMALSAIEAGLHVFIEKPITATSDEARAVLEAACRRGVKIGVGHIERFNPVFSVLGDIVVAPLFIESHRLTKFTSRSTDVAVVLDLMIHDIDLILTLVGQEIVDVRSSGVSIVTDELDIANARIEFAGGCVANLTASRMSQRPMRKMRVFQRDAYLSVDFAKPSIEIFTIDVEGQGPPGDTYGGVGVVNEGTTLLGTIDSGTRFRSIRYDRPEIIMSNALEDELRDFVFAIVRDGDPRVTGEAATEALRVAEEVVDQIHRRNSLLDKR